MNKIFVYYSMTGNVHYVAGILKEKMNIDLLRIEPVKEYPDKGFKKFFWGGKSAVMKETPNLVKYQFDSNKYDEIIIGTPVWASNITPPIRTFINENKDSLKNKKISVVISNSGGNAIKVIDKLKKELGIDKFNSELILIDPKDKPNKDNNLKIEMFINIINKPLN